MGGAWDFVRNNEGVVNLEEGNFAEAMPPEVDWTGVRFEKEPTIIPSLPLHQFYVKWINGLGNQCAEIYYRIHWYAHGRHTSNEDGYISQFTQLVDRAHAAWGVDVNAKSVVGPPTRVDSDSPGAVVGALTMNLDMWSGSAHEYNNLVVRGDGSCEFLNAGKSSTCQGPTPAPSGNTDLSENVADVSVV